MLGSSATRSLVLQSCAAFRAYMHAHHGAWHAFAAALGHTLDARDIVLVSGWLKAASWALAACTRALNEGLAAMGRETFAGGI